MNYSHTTVSVLVVTLALYACGGGGSGDSESQSFAVRSTNVATSTSTPVRISGAYIAFLAAEDATSTGGNPATDLNGDGDVGDGIAHVVNTAANTQFRLGVAATHLAWAGSELYLAVDEAQDGHNWNADPGLTDDVLLHWSEATGMLQRVDDLATDAAVPFVPLNGRIVYVAKESGANPGESNLRFVEAAAPLVPIGVFTTDAVGPLDAQLLGEDEGLVFLVLDEPAARSLNGDADFDDLVLALLDGGASTNIARSTGLAVDPTKPFRAKSTGTSDWRVGFLVSEAAQGGLNRNSSAVGLNFRPSYCAGDDNDATDHVLAVLEFADWDMDPVANQPVNHGLAGRERIAFAGEYVATIVSEVDDSCNLNNDANSTDRVVRWLAVADSTLEPILPINTAVHIRALFDAPGGGNGLYELADRFVIVASESEGGDIDANNALDADLVGWLAPATDPNQWDFSHGESGTQFVEASWVSARASENRLGVAFTERVGNFSLNPGTASNPGDNDTNDAIPTFAQFVSGRMAFPGVGLALDRDSAGITTANNWSFYRVNEVEDGRDINDDGDETDLIVERTNLTSGATFGLSVATNVQRDVVDFARFGGRSCGAMLASEASQGSGGTDFNGDGDRTDVVLRWFRF